MGRRGCTACRHWLRTAILEFSREFGFVDVTLHLSDEQAAAIQAQAAAEGMPMDTWLERLAEQHMPAVAVRRPASDRPIWEEIVDNMKDVPDEVFDRLPHDGASQVDHYIYGLPKRDS